MVCARMFQSEAPQEKGTQMPPERTMGFTLIEPFGKLRTHDGTIILDTLQDGANVVEILPPPAEGSLEWGEIRTGPGG